MKISRWTLGGLLAVALAFAMPATAVAQGVTTGAIAGTITNDQHQPVENAQIQVTNRVTGFSSRVTTKSDGRYTVPGLDVGSNYSVTVRRIGFQPQMRDNIVVVLSQVTRVDIELVTQATQLQAVSIVANQDPVMSSSHTGAHHHDLRLGATPPAHAEPQLHRLRRPHAAGLHRGTRPVRRRHQ